MRTDDDHDHDNNSVFINSDHIHFFKFSKRINHLVLHIRSVQFMLNREKEKEQKTGLNSYFKSCICTIIKFTGEDRFSLV